MHQCSKNAKLGQIVESGGKATCVFIKKDRFRILAQKGTSYKRGCTINMILRYPSSMPWFFSHVFVEYIKAIMM